VLARAIEFHSALCRSGARARRSSHTRKTICGLRFRNTARLTHVPTHLRAATGRRGDAAQNHRRLRRHRSPQSTRVYGKVAIETLREVALGDGADVLQSGSSSPWSPLCAGSIGGKSLAGSDGTMGPGENAKAPGGAPARDGQRYASGSCGRVPRAYIECHRRESRVTMTWSTIGMPMMREAAISFAVVAMSSGLGDGSPLGWL
jgi:hypothetical protein